VPEFRIGIVRGGACRLSATRSSITIFCAATARGLADFTFMPTLGVRLQEAASTRSPSTSTMQAPAIAVGPVVRFGRITQMRNFATLALGHLPYGLAVDGLDLLAVEFELDAWSFRSFLRKKLVGEIFND
jgi:hypothetical protein